MEYPITYHTDEAVEALMKERNALDTRMAKLKEARAKVDQKLKALLLEDAGKDKLSFRYGPMAVRVKPKVTLKAKPDQEAFIYEYLNEFGDMRRLFGLYSVRKTALEEAAKSYRSIDEETGEVLGEGWEAFRRDCFEWIESDEAEVSVLPLDRAPKFIQALNDGEGVDA